MKAADATFGVLVKPECLGIIESIFLLVTLVHELHNQVIQWLCPVQLGGGSPKEPVECPPPLRGHECIGVNKRLVVAVFSTEGHQLAFLGVGAVGNIASAELWEHLKQPVCLVRCPGNPKKNVGGSGDLESVPDPCSILLNFFLLLILIQFGGINLLHDQLTHLQLGLLVHLQKVGVPLSIQGGVGCILSFPEVGKELVGRSWFVLVSLCLGILG